MSISYESVVPWGRSFDEYVAMFALSEADLGGRILGCADGPAAFNARLTGRGGSVVSADPLYVFSAEVIRARIDETFERVMEQTRDNRDAFVWDRIPSLEALGQKRMAAMEEFLADYPAGRAQGRYIPAELPGLPFADGSFDIALSSHYLFLYSEQLDGDFHVRAIEEMCRVALEARVFPLMEMGPRSRHVDAVLAALRSAGYRATVERVDYEFQVGGNEMLRVRAPGV